MYVSIGWTYIPDLVEELQNHNTQYVCISIF